ncbi:helix-turn-helix domain-containing protein [Serratia fonticola]|uniref:helix-turn-helix domain-containing protein n=1 Tax=Serratia fonticola TaxID=47917 RepID=UPI003AAA7C90
MNRTDNLTHKALFTIPAPSYGTALATTKPLPPQRVITGHKQTDAYLWVLEVIRLNEPAHLQAAEDALKKLKITPKQAQERYSDYLMKSGADPFQIAFGTMSMDNPQGCIDGARRNIDKASQVRATFGSYEAALENTQAEALMLADGLGDIYESGYFWNEKELAENCMYGDRINETSKQRKEISKGFVDQLPQPATLSDVVREFQYWDWLYTMRDSAEKELGYEYANGERTCINDREEYLETLLSKIKPSTRQEAIEVCKWILDEDRFMDRGDLTDSIFLNLVGECG